MSSAAENENGSLIPSRRATFRAAFKGLTAWHAAKAFNRLVPGREWRGVSKTELLREWTTGRLAEFSGADLRRAVAERAVPPLIGQPSPIPGTLDRSRPPSVDWTAPNPRRPNLDEIDEQ